MNQSVFRKLLLLPLVIGLIDMLAAGSALGVRTFVVGGEENPWEKSGTTPGGVIDFVDSLSVLTGAQGHPMFPGVSGALLGWILPVQISGERNISIGTLDRGGSIIVPMIFEDISEALKGIISGDHSVAFERKPSPAKPYVKSIGIAIDLDLGARFGVSRIKFFPRMSEEFPFKDDFLRGYEIFLNDGTEETSFAGVPIYTLVKRVEENNEPVVDESFSLQYVRYIRIKSITTIGFEIDEIEVYGAGFVPNAAYVSNAFDFEDIATWGRIRWSEERAGNLGASKITVRTRSGKDNTPEIYNRITAEGEEVPFNEVGKLLTEKEYNKLKEHEKGSITLDSNNWSSWQPVANGAQIVSPAPRRFFQFRIDFESNALNAARSVGFLSLEFSKPPVAHEIAAEISPRRVEPGRITTFTYALRPTILGDDTGFDSFEIATPARVNTIRTVEILDPDWNIVVKQDFGEDLDEIRMPFEKGDFAIEAVEDDHFTVSFPKITRDQMLLKVIFDTAVFRFGTKFTGKAFDSGSDELAQLVVAGDATPELDTNDLLVQMSLGASPVSSAVASPNPFTPNNDGFNDTTEISYNILHLIGEAWVTVEIYDLPGNLKKTMDSKIDAAGRFSKIWDGRDSKGELVPPGIYVFRVSMSADVGEEGQVGLVSVVY